MVEGKKSFQAVLNIFGFILIVAGLSIDGPISFAMLGGAVLTFVIAILVAISGNNEDEEANGS